MPPLHQLFFLSLWALTCGYAAVRGGAPERLAAASLVAAVVLTVVFSLILHPTSGYYSSVEFGVAMTDVGLFLVLLLMALASTRFWPMLMTSMQGCGMLGHLAKPLGPDIIPKAYYVTVAFWGYPIVLLLAWATWRHRLRVRRYGVDYAWVWQLPRRYRNGWSVDELARPIPEN